MVAAIQKLTIALFVFLLFPCSKFVEAESFYREAIKCLGKFPKSPSLQKRLMPRISLGLCLKEIARYDESEKELGYCLLETLHVKKKERDAAFENTCLHAMAAVATLKQAQSKYGEATEMYKCVLPMARARAETEHNSFSWLANHVASYAEILRKSGELDMAKKLHEEALEYRLQSVDSDLLEVAVSFTQLGCTSRTPADAYIYHKKALGARVELLDFDHALVSGECFPSAVNIQSPFSCISTLFLSISLCLSFLLIQNL